MPPDLEPASALPTIDMTPVDHPKSPAEEFALKLLTESWVDETGQHDRRVMARLIQEAELAIRADEREPLERRIAELEDCIGWRDGRIASLMDQLAGSEEQVTIRQEALRSMLKRAQNAEQRSASLEAQLASALPWVREGLEHASTEQEARALVGSIEALLTSPSKSPWIPVEERLPEEYGTVLALEAGGTWPMCVVYHDGTWFNVDNGSSYDVTHWMPPLAAPPELPPPAAQKAPHAR